MCGTSPTHTFPNLTRSKKLDWLLHAGMVGRYLGDEYSDTVLMSLPHCCQEGCDAVLVRELCVCVCMCVCVCSQTDSEGMHTASSIN